MRKPLSLLMSGLISFAFLADITGAADAHHRFNRHHVHHKKVKHMKRVKHVKRYRKPALPPIVVADIDISTQTMNVNVNGWSYGNWDVSTGREGFITPQGAFGVQRMAQVYYSKKYDNSPMPNSVFFSGGNAIHGSYHIKQLGRPASHGCVRLAPANAAAFYSLVSKYGSRRTRITIHS
jgi:L,D-transpeptidase catalytic domain